MACGVRFGRSASPLLREPPHSPSYAGSPALSVLLSDFPRLPTSLLPILPRAITTFHYFSGFAQIKKSRPRAAHSLLTTFSLLYLYFRFTEKGIQERADACHHLLPRSLIFLDVTRRQRL